MVYTSQYDSIRQFKTLVQLQQKLIIKVGVANAIKNVITMNLRKQLTSAGTFYNEVSLQKLVGKIKNISEYQLEHGC